MSINLLDLSANFIDFAVETIGLQPLSWIGKIIQWLIEGIGIIGLGVIVFTLILKTIVLPLDVYSRIKMKKQSLMMKKMRPQMEKLQKQYANDQSMYSQKVMELQKENGISMVGACIPMVITLIIFMTVFGSFSTYSQFANVSTYNNMVNNYNESVQEYVLTDLQENVLHSDGFLVEEVDLTLIDYSNANIDVSKVDLKTLNLQKTDELGEEFFKEIYLGSEEEFAKLKEDEINELRLELKETVEKIKAYRVDFNAFVAKIEGDKNYPDGLNSKYFQNLYLNLYKLKEMPEGVKVSEKFTGMNENEKIYFVRSYVKENGRIAAATAYRDNRNNFLWIGNIWYPDSPLNKELPDFSKFSSSVTRATTGMDTSYETSYDEVTYYLRNSGFENENGKIEGNTVNGYFILIALAIGLMFLQQFISMRSQKDANELNTVDGSGAKTNKWMLIMMPIIYGVFSFFYSAAFSLYMITNTIYGLITTLIINKAMDVSFKKQEANGGFNIKRKKNNRKRLK